MTWTIFHFSLPPHTCNTFFLRLLIALCLSLTFLFWSTDRRFDFYSCKVNYVIKRVIAWSLWLILTLGCLLCSTVIRWTILENLEREFVLLQYNIYWYKIGLLKKFSLLINLSTVFWTWYIVYSVWITFIFYGICCIVNKAFKVMQTRVIEFSDAIFFMVTFLSKCRRIKIISEFSFNQIYPCNSERLVLRKRSWFYEKRITSI